MRSMLLFFVFAVGCLCASAFSGAGIFGRGLVRASKPVATRLCLTMHTYSPKETAQAAIKASKIVVFSKTHCPYSKRAKEAISALTPMFSVVELDVVKDGAEQQAALFELTGQKTVPNIFIGGKHLGGCDATLAAIASGEFQKLIAA